MQRRYSTCKKQETQRTRVASEPFGLTHWYCNKILFRNFTEALAKSIQSFASVWLLQMIVALIIKTTLWNSPLVSWKPHDLGFRNKSWLWSASGKKMICGLGEMLWFLLDGDVYLGCWGYKAWDFPWMVPFQSAPYPVPLWPSVNWGHRVDVLNPKGWEKARNTRIAP